MEKFIALKRYFTDITGTIYAINILHLSTSLLLQYKTYRCIYNGLQGLGSFLHCISTAEMQSAHEIF